MELWFIENSYGFWIIVHESLFFIWLFESELNMFDCSKRLMFISKYDLLLHSNHYTIHVDNYTHLFTYIYASFLQMIFSLWACARMLPRNITATNVRQKKNASNACNLQANQFSLTFFLWNWMKQWFMVNFVIVQHLDIVE